MFEPVIQTLPASDGYPMHVAHWSALGTLKGRVLILHGVQSHGGWYRKLSGTLSSAGYEVTFPDRRGSGANRQDRGHAPSSGRLIADVADVLRTLRERTPAVPIALAGISWGGKLVVLAAGKHPEMVDAIALICPGLEPRVGVSRRERLRIALAYFVRRRKTFPIPLADPALFTANLEKQAFIVNDPLSLREATAGLLAASAFLDRRLKRIPPLVQQPALLMLAGQDRIVDNDRTLSYFERLASRDRRVIEYPEAHHTLEFEPDPDRYIQDLIAWLDEALVSPTPTG
ncbi:alpha/beta hydrolase [soil metagenome]